jgi:hypothetical protein
VCWLIDPLRQKVYPFSFLLLHLPFIFTCVSTCTTEKERCCMRPVHVDWVRDAGGLWSAEEEKEKWEVDVVNRRKGSWVSAISLRDFRSRQEREGLGHVCTLALRSTYTPVLVVFIFFLFFFQVEMVNIGWCQPWNSLLFSFEKNRRRRSLKSRKHGECINTFQLSGKLSTFNRSLLPIFSLFSIPLFIILFSAFPWLYIFWVGVGPICRLFFYQFTGVGQSANTLCTVTYTHFVHIIGLPPPPIFPYTNGPILAAIHVQWRAEKIRKN